MIEHIKHVTPWMTLDDIGSSTSKDMGKYWSNLYDGDYIGVYQVSLEQPEELIHPEIGYIGKSKILPTRMYELSNNTRSLKSNHHNCGRYLRDQGITTDKIYFRCLFADEQSYGDLESYLQDQMTEKYGYSTGFKWIQASAGTQSTFLKFKDIVNRLKPEELYEANGYIISRMVQEEILKQKKEPLDNFK
jgi:hypothetical protein